MKLTHRNLKREARKAWAEVEQHKKGKRVQIGVGPRALLHWYAGYAAALDWAAQMAKHNEKLR